MSVQSVELLQFNNHVVLLSVERLVLPDYFGLVSNYLEVPCVYCVSNSSAGGASRFLAKHVVKPLLIY